MLFRDDDVSKYTDIQTFLDIHALFLHYGLIHTVAVEMDGLFDSRGVWQLLGTLPNLAFGLHGWQHREHWNMTEEDVYDDFKRSLDYWNEKMQRSFGRIPELKVHYPTWDKVSPSMVKACDRLGMSIDARVGVENGVFNFHWWEFVGGINIKRLQEVMHAESKGVIVKP